MRRVRRAVGLLAVLALLATAPSATANQQVSAGALRAEVASDPWHIEFTDAAGKPVLSEFPATGVGPSGTLGFRTPAGWFHATRVASEGFSGNAFAAELETTDPLGRRLEVRIEPAGDGTIRIAAGVTGPITADVTAVGVGFQSRAGERYLGFGERSNAVDQRGNSVESYVADGPYQAEEYPLISLFVPTPGVRPRDDSTYFPMPWLLSTAGYGVLVENFETSHFRLGTDESSAWSLEAEAKELSFRVFAGPSPADVLRRLTEFTGRQPPPAAPWFLGPWYQPVADDELAEADALRAADVPSSAVNTFTHYLPCGDQQGAEQSQVDRAAGFHARGLAVTTYFNPMVCVTYSAVFDVAASRGLLTQNQLGEPYVYRYTGTEQFPVGQFDFSNPEAREYYGELLAEAVGHGYDGWMEDFGEYTPLDSRSANGMGGEQMHNFYPVLYHRASWEFASTQDRPVAGFIRSGWTGVHPYAQLVWGGDPTTEWGFDGLESAMWQGLTLGTSGISRWGSDIGGFFSLFERELTTELLIRWIEFGAVSGIMRTEANGFAFPAKSRPQITDPDVLPVWRRYAKLRTQLYPYLAAAEEEYHRTGLPLMRHLALAYPDDPAAAARDDEFMFGPDLLAAPVVRPGETSRRVYLPAGRWVDVWRAVSFAERTGGLRLRGSETMQGGEEVSVASPLDELPLIARAGAVIPLLPASVDTLAHYPSAGRSASPAPLGGSDPVTGLDDVKRRLELLAFPRGRSRAAFGEDGVIRSREGKRPRWLLKLRAGERKMRYSLQASLATLSDPFDPCRVRLNGERLRQRKWSYDAGSQVLEARFKAPKRTARLLVRPGRCG
jgi:alpha-glucosidase (family GH31 glycosyl hydrolase)